MDLRERAVYMYKDFSSAVLDMVEFNEIGLKQPMHKIRHLSFTIVALPNRKLCAFTR